MASAVHTQSYSTRKASAYPHTHTHTGIFIHKHIYSFHKTKNGHWPFPSVTHIYLHILNTPSSVPSLNIHTRAHTHILIHNADLSFCPVNAAQLGSAQQQQNSALCSFLPPLLVLLNSATYTPAHAHTHSDASITSTRLSFFLPNPCVFLC